MRNTAVPLQRAYGMPPGQCPLFLRVAIPETLHARRPTAASCARALRLEHPSRPPRAAAACLARRTLPCRAGLSYTVLPIGIDVAITAGAAQLTLARPRTARRLSDRRGVRRRRASPAHDRKTRSSPRWRVRDRRALGPLGTRLHRRVGRRPQAASIGVPRLPRASPPTASPSTSTTTAAVRVVRPLRLPDVHRTSIAPSSEAGAAPGVCLLSQGDRLPLLRGRTAGASGSSRRPGSAARDERTAA